MLSTHFCKKSSLQLTQTQPQMRAQNHQKGLQPATCVPPTCANQHQQTQKGKFDAELKSSDSCWCQLLPGSCSLHILPAPTTQPTHQQVWFGTQSSFQREPEHLRHLHEGARLMGQGFEAVLKALGGFASVEVEPEDLQNSSSSASGGKSEAASGRPEPPMRHSGAIRVRQLRVSDRRGRDGASHGRHRRRHRGQRHR